jgi:DNA replication and repair protein RecF
MRILSIAIERFRNICAAELEPTPHFTALIGPNGQGKTNTLEAIYLVAALRPLRPVQRRALIQSGSPRARVAMRVERRSTGLIHDLEVALEGRGRELKKDGKIADTASFLGHAVAVAFTPDDLSLPKGGPEARRRFLDRALLNLKPSYLSRALRYSKAIKERNRLLATGGLDSVLDAYDEVIAEEGSAIMIARAEYASEIAARVEAEFEGIAHPAPKLALAYSSTLDRDLEAGSHTATKARFLERLAIKRSDDRRRKATSVGPHLDDLEITLDGVLVKERASQGQHRAIVLALKLAEIAHLSERLGEPPILLLDDMSSELDHDRSEQLFEAIGRREGQVILTSTEEPKALIARLGSSAPLKTYDVSEGGLRARP